MGLCLVHVMSQILAVRGTDLSATGHEYYVILISSNLGNLTTMKAQK